MINFEERAINAINEKEKQKIKPFYEGIDFTHNQLHQTLKKYKIIELKEVD